MCFCWYKLNGRGFPNARNTNGLPLESAIAKLILNPILCAFSPAVIVNASRSSSLNCELPSAIPIKVKVLNTSKTAAEIFFMYFPFFKNKKQNICIVIIFKR